MVLWLGYWAYCPGLSGAFQFDDFSNLNALGGYGRLDNWPSFLFFLTSGTADPVGRPLALLSFLLNADTWPADPEPFKYTNVLIHLLNGALLTWVLLKLGKRLNLSQQQTELSALIGASLWFLHPLMVSTTLYVVQRQAMLAATFTLIGILFWINGTTRLKEGRPKAIACMGIGAYACTFLAVLCKSNGALMPLLLLILDWVLPDCEPAGSPKTEARLRYYRLVFLGTPTILLAFWLALQIPHAQESAATYRSWTIWQRLITEPRVLIDYLRLLAIPRASLSGLFNDNFVPSTDLLHPWTTLPSIIAITAVIVGAIVMRQRYPALCFAVLFYFAGHLLESTFLPLELYFEHRNYLPSAILFWPPALWLMQDGQLKTVRRTFAVILIAAFILLLHERASLWGNPSEQAALFAIASPGSSRSQVEAAIVEMNNGYPRRAEQRLQQAILAAPSDVQLSLNLVDIECKLGSVSPEAVSSAFYAIGHTPFLFDFTYQWLLRTTEVAASGSCRGLNLDQLGQLEQTAKANPYFSKWRTQEADFKNLEGRIALARGNGNLALQAFNESLDAHATPDIVLIQSALLGGKGFPQLGLKHIAYYQSLPSNYKYPKAFNMAALHSWLLDRYGYWDSEFRHMEFQLQDDADNRLANIVPGPGCRPLHTCKLHGH
jgi:hypothetical protein